MKRLVVVDDEPDILEVARLSLETMTDWEVRTADSGLPGFELIRSDPPDAVLLDFRMPDIDGLEVFRRLREDPATASVPVIFLTASTNRIEREAVFETAATGLIEKPFDPMTLAQQVSDMLGWGST